MTRLETLFDKTAEAYMAADYGSDAWEASIEELIGAGYSDSDIEWIMRSKIARWAYDAETSPLQYIKSAISPTLLRQWIEEGE